MSDFYYSFPTNLFKNECLTFCEVLALTTVVVIRKLKSKNNTKESGGIVIYVKSKFAQNIESTKSEHNDVLWLKLKKNISIFKKIYILEQST